MLRSLVLRSAYAAALLSGSVFAQFREPMAQPSMAKLPVYFEPNLGQFHSDVRFLSRGARYRAWITDSELVLQFFGKPAQDGRVEQDVTRIRFGKQKPAQAEGLDKLPGISNYFVGQDPKKWVTNVPNYQRAKLHEVYPGIDIVFYASGRSIEYDFVVKPGADPSQIQVDFPAGQPLKFDPSGLISMRNRLGGELTQQPPKVYQGKSEIGVFPQLLGRTLRFPLGKYDPDQELVLDPVLIYSTMVGGNRTDQIWDGDAHAITGKVRVDASGNLYFAALSYSGSNATNSFPTTSGAYQTTYQGGVDDAIVVKLNPTGTALIFSTYLGSAGADAGRGIALDASSNVYVAGTGGTNFPTTAGAFQTARTVAGQQNLFVTKLSAAGNALLYSTFVGSAGETTQAIEVNSDNEAIVASATCGPTVCGAGQGLPTPLVNAAQGTYGGAFADATLFKLNAAGSALVFSTYHGGGGNEWATALTLGPTGDIFIGGQGPAPVTPGAFAGNPNGSAWVAKYSASGARTWAARIGGVGNDKANGIAVDSQNQPVITGQSAFIADSARLWPTTPGTIQTTNPSLCSNHYITKFNATGSGLVWSTFLAGKAGFCAEGTGIAIDSQDNVWVTGTAFNQSGAMPLLPVTADAYQSTIAGGSDITIAKVNPTATAVLYATYFGGTGGEYAHGIALDSTGDNAYVAGFTSATVPTTTGAVSSGEVDLAFLRFGPQVNVTIESSPSGLSFDVTGTGCAAGTGYVTPQTLSWTPGRSCTVTFASPQSGSVGVRYAFDHWEDASTNRSRTITAPNSDTTYTAGFRTQYLLNTFAGVGGIITPPSGYYDAGNVQIEAIPNSGYRFNGFSGTISGLANPRNINLAAPTTVNASFVPNTATVTVRTNPPGLAFSVDGTPYTSSQTFTFDINSDHVISTSEPQDGTAGTRYFFRQWSDLGNISHSYHVTGNSTVTAFFDAVYQLTTTAGPGGTISPATGFFTPGGVAVTATPNPGFEFAGFTGALTGTTNPQTLTLTGPATVSATFRQLGPAALLIGPDDTTKGAWRSQYGRDGYFIPTLPPALPSYATVNVLAGTQYLWASDPTGAEADRALDRPVPPPARIASAVIHNTQVRLALNFSDSLTHRVAFYMTDWQASTTAQTFEILDAATNAVLASQSVTSFRSGRWLVYTLRGNVIIRITRTAGSWAQLNGIFFGNASASSLSANGGTPQTTAINTAFAAPLSVLLRDSSNLPVAGATVNFAVPGAGASAALSSLTAITNGSGIASVTATANGTAGSYIVTASALGATASFSLTNESGSPASLTATGGTPQSARISTGFTNALQVLVRDAGGNAIPNLAVAFAAPGAGASAALSAPTATTNASGVASITAAANTVIGTYNVTATVGALQALFALTNTPGPAASITATAGAPQSAFVGAGFAAALQATVRDSGGNPVSGVTVQFTPPASGASAVLSSSTAVTNASGVASVTATANATQGSYTVNATVAGVAAPAAFALTNNASASGAASATLILSDSTTAGNWKGSYGTQGYFIPNHGTSLPTWATLTHNGTNYTWDPNPAGPEAGRALERITPPGRFASAVIADTQFQFSLNLTDGLEHRVAFYMTDWPSTVGAERITILDATNNTVISTQDVTAFRAGRWLLYNLRGNLIVRVTRTAGNWAQINGVFFGSN